MTSPSHPQDRGQPAGEEAPAAGTLALLGDGVYRAYWLSGFFYFLAFGAQRFALVLFVLELTDRAGLGGLVGFALGVPAFFITIPAGVWADRLDRRWMLSIAFTAGALLMALLSAGIFADVVTSLVALAAALAIGFVLATVMPPLTAIVQMIVPPERLVNGIVLRTMGQNLAQFIGAAAAGLAIAAVGYGGAFALLAAIYVLALVSIRRVHLPAQPAAPVARPRMLSAAAEGARFVFGRSALRALVASAVMTGLFQVGPIFVLVPEIGRTILEVGPGPNSLLFAANSAGMLAMSTFLATRRGLSRKGLWFQVNLLLAGPALILIGISPWYPLTALGMAFWGMNGGVHINLNQALIQLNTPDAVMGRVMAIYMLSIAGLIPLGSLFAGMVAEVIGADWALVGSGVIFAAYALPAYLTQRDLRTLD
jgi:MFS family permease